MYRKLRRSYTPKMIAEAIGSDSSNGVDALVKCMSSALVLSQRAHAYHWNYIGESFAELHKVFGDIYDDLSGKVDELAERVRALDSVPPSSLSDMIKNSSVDDDDSNLDNSSEMVGKLLDGFVKFQECLKDSLKAVKSDDASFDLLSGHLVDAEKTIWMLKSTK